MLPTACAYDGSSLCAGIGVLGGTIVGGRDSCDVFARMERFRLRGNNMLFKDELKVRKERFVVERKCHALFVYLFSLFV